MARLALASSTAVPLRTSSTSANRLPPEILLAVLDYATQTVALTFASVSRAWRAVAKKHRCYYLYIPIYRNHWYGARRLPRPAPRVAPALEALMRASREGIRVAVTLHLAQLSPDEKPPFWPWEGKRDQRALRRILRTMQAALPVSVFRLDIVCADWGTNIWTLLSQPAPQLESFAIYASTDQYHPHYVSESLFSGSAPRLRDVTLRGMYLPHSAVPAFSAVEIVRITSFVSPSTTWPITTLFPNIKSLELTLDPLIPDVERGLLSSLCRLSLSADESISAGIGLFPFILAIPVPDIPHLGYSGFKSVSGLDEAQQTLVGPCELKIDCEPFPCNPRSRQYTARFSCPGRILTVELIYPATWIPALARVDTLYITQRSMDEFIRTLPAQTQLPVLTSLVIELNNIHFFHWPLDVPANRPTISCPALREVRIVWRSTAGQRPEITPLHLDIMEMCLSLKSHTLDRPQVSLRLHNVHYNGDSTHDSVFCVQGEGMS